MDIVTHALMGYALAAPVLPAAPVTAGCFVLGSVLPDLDSLSRCFGKRAFLRWHQTYTHSLPAIVGLGLAAWFLIPQPFHEPWAPVALMAGMLLHVTLDVTNTYGTAILSPLSRRRFCTEWIFFIDAVVIIASVAAVLLQGLAIKPLTPAAIAIGYGVVLLLYWIIRIMLNRRARRMAPTGTMSLIPSALIPWRYFGCARETDGVRCFSISALTGRLDREERHAILDAAYAAILTSLPEFRIMRELSPAYHVIEAICIKDVTHIRCRDLRVRNFGGRFGELEVVLDPDGQITRRHLHV